MTLRESYSEAVSKFFVLKGRTNREKYWKFILANWLIKLGIGILPLIATGTPWIWLGYAVSAYATVMSVPELTATVRRLHDGNRSGWMLFMIATAPAIAMVLFVAGILGESYGSSALLFAIGGLFGLAYAGTVIVALVTLVSKGDASDNDYGAPDSEAVETAVA